MAVCARNSPRSGPVVRIGGAACGLTTSSGCGSNVTRTLARCAARARSAISPKHRLVTQMHPIERADGDRTAALQWWQSAHGVPRTTAGRSTRPRLGRRRPARPLAPARHPPGAASSAATARPWLIATRAASSSSHTGKWPSTVRTGRTESGPSPSSGAASSTREVADRLAPQRGEVRTEAEPLTEVTGDGPKIRARAHRGPKDHIRMRGTRPAPSGGSSR